MSRVERWIYRDLLELYFDTENPLTSDFDCLCHLVGIRTENERLILQGLLRHQFVQVKDGFAHPRCAKEIAARHIKANASRVNGKRGGRPSTNDAAKNGALLPARDHSVIGMPPKAKRPPLPRKKPQAMTDLPDWLPLDCWNGFLTMRSNIKKPLSSQAIPLALKKLSALREAGHDPRAVLEQSIFYAWQGLFEIRQQHTSSQPAVQSTALASAQHASTEAGRRRLFGAIVEQESHA